MSKLYVQYGCGLSAPEQWVNFDVSPTLRLQKIPVIGHWLKGRSAVVFPANVKYGNIVKGLPVAKNSCDGIYCSHTLEHLSLEDLRASLKNTLGVLKPGGLFRCVVPDLEIAAKEYIESIKRGSKDGSIQFLKSTMLGLQTRPRGAKELLQAMFGNSHHLWMWDVHSLGAELENAGFKNIRPCQFDDSADPMFKYVESEGRFWHAAAMECTK